jgi:hypothetical protein
MAAKMKLLNIHRRCRIAWLTLCMLVLIDFAALGLSRAQDVVSPGPLSSAHAAIENQCTLCHVPLQGTPDAKCLACHTVLARQITAKRGYHSGIVTTPCTSCHQEHKGRHHAIAPEPENFDHRLAKFELLGKHRELKCASCHQTTGPAKWTGLGTTCISCHVDKVHRGSLGSSCASCHSNERWKPVAYQREDHTTSMKGGHAAATCVDCHKSGARLAKQLACTVCHKPPHPGASVTRGCTTCHEVASWNKTTYAHSFPSSKLPGTHLQSTCLSCHPGFTFERTSFRCARCHEKDIKHEPLGPCDKCHSASTWESPTIDHSTASIGFALSGKHEQVACAQCHTKPGPGSKTLQSFKVASTKCASCHAIPAHGDFGKCESCHQTTGFAPSSFRHDSTRMPLIDKHQQVACQNCHAAKVAAAPSDVVQACNTCHVDTHHGQFVSASGSPPCSQCHNAKGWKPSLFGFVQHASTAFPLSGQHIVTTCGECHRSGSYAATPTACAQCHIDTRHNTRLGSACQRCHQAGSWKAVTGFDHRKETGFALERGHAKRACTSCHNANGSRFTSLPLDKRVTSACQTCHQPRHRDDFSSNCLLCHTLDTFEVRQKYDHARETGFALEQRHAVIECSSCHDRSKYVKTPTTCRGCHGDPHRGSNAYECEDCHRADRWRVIRFDHSQTSYPLEGHHNVTACGRCHTNPNWLGVPTQCITCHAGERPPTRDHIGKNECSDCHVPLSWKAIVNQ